MSLVNDATGSGSPSGGLVRVRQGRWIAGVCAGIARRYGWPAGRVRLIFVLSSILPGPQFLIYVALWILLPVEDRPTY